MPDLEEFKIFNTDDLSEDPVDALLNEYLKRRILIFNDEVGDFILENYVLFIIKWNREDEYIPIEKRKKIRLYINSPGGLVVPSHMLIDAIMQSKTPVIGVGYGFVASASFHIFLACHERVGFKNTILLQHDGDISIKNSSKKVKDTMAFFDEMDEKTKQFVLSRTFITSELYDEIYDMEFYMTVEKAKELGVLHKIIGEDCDLSYIW